MKEEINYDVMGKDEELAEFLEKFHEENYLFKKSYLDSNWQKHTFYISIDENGTDFFRKEEKITISNKKEFLEQIEMSKIEIEEIDTAIEEIVTYAKNMDPDAFHDPYNKRLYVFGQKISFHLTKRYLNKKTVKKGTYKEETFGLKFATEEDGKVSNSLGKGFYKSAELDKLIKKAKDILNKKYEKNKLKFLVQSNNEDSKNKYINYIFKKSFKKSVYELNAIESEINEYFSKNLKNDVILEVSEEEKNKLTEEMNLKKEKALFAKTTQYVFVRQGTKVLILENK